MESIDIFICIMACIGLVASIIGLHEFTDWLYIRSQLKANPKLMEQYKALKEAQQQMEDFVKSILMEDEP